MDKKVSVRARDYSARRGNWCERHLSIFSAQFLAARTHYTVRTIKSNCQSFFFWNSHTIIQLLLWRNPAFLPTLLPFFCKVGNVEKFQFGHERLVMPAAEADWFTEGSKVVRQGRFRNSSGELRHDGDNPLSRDKTHWPMFSSFLIRGQLEHAIT